MTPFMRKFKATAQEYKSDRKGSFSIMAAVSLIAIVGCVALAIDASNGYFENQRLQDTTDAIALIAAKDKITDEGELMSLAEDYFTMVYGAEADRITLNSITRTEDTVQVNATNQVDTFFSSVFTQNSLNVSAQSSATYAERNLDVAMVLDTTFSMQGEKMTSLKASANSLVDTINEFDVENRRVSVVPFAQYVNVGLSRRNAPWLNVPGDIPDVQQCEMRSDVISRTNCRIEQRTCTSDGVSFPCNRRKCDVVRGPQYEVCTTRDATWQGCVGSRTNGLDVSAPYGATKIPGLLDSEPGRRRVNCGEEIRPLTANLNEAKMTINAMVPRRNLRTYMPSGLLWGWRTLNNELPLTEAASSAEDTDKVLILMSDGENTKSKTGIRHDGTSKADADDKTTALCNAIKRDEIRVFTIAYEVNDADTLNLLSDCATSPGDFFDASNASQLQNAFDIIGQSLQELRIST